LLAITELALDRLVSIAKLCQDNPFNLDISLAGLVTAWNIFTYFRTWGIIDT